MEERQTVEDILDMLERQSDMGRLLAFYFRVRLKNIAIYLNLNLRGIQIYSLNIH